MIQLGEQYCVVDDYGHGFSLGDIITAEYHTIDSGTVANFSNPKYSWGQWLHEHQVELVNFTLENK